MGPSRSSARLPAVVAFAIIAAVSGAALLAHAERTGLVQRDGGLAAQRPERLFGALLLAAFVGYVVAMVLTTRASFRLRVAIVVAIVIQTVPLTAPVLLSTDAWTYWGYGWIAADGGNPYREPPSAYPESPAAAHLGAAWRETTTVYGPAFTGASELVARAVGSSPDAAGWAFKTLAAAAAIAATLLAAALARSPTLAVVAVGWNPLLAVHAAGGGHNDAWVGALALAAVLAARRARPAAEGALWTLAVAVKWVPVVLLPLRLAAARSRRLVTSLALTAGGIVALASMRYGSGWVEAITPLARNAATKTSYAFPARLEQLGAPSTAALGVVSAVLVAGYVCLVRLAASGKPRYGLGACLTLLSTPYLAVWYLGWAVPLAAVDDEDRLPLVLATALGAYLLPQAVPL
ncbi:MAG: glycosyltransferase 87 family protein [Gaiellales bacterium]